jgi:hypothetical protein
MTEDDDDDLYTLLMLSEPEREDRRDWRYHQSDKEIKIGIVTWNLERNI